MLTKSQQEALHTTMNRRLADLRLLIGEEASVEEDERGRQQGADVGDFGDEPVDADLARTELALIDLHRREVRQIEDAMTRLTTGHYGLCVDCREPIEFERLKISPIVQRCEPCQRQFEITRGGPARTAR
jgi:RNA polymerase-binding transcription factor DksA